MKLKKDFYKKKNTFLYTEKKDLHCFVLYFRVVSEWRLCLILISDMLIWSAGWTCVFYLKYLCVIDAEFSHTTQQDLLTPLNCGLNWKFYFVFFQIGVCVHASMCEVVFEVFNGQWDLFSTEAVARCDFFDWLCRRGCGWLYVGCHFYTWNQDIHWKLRAPLL